MLKLYILVVKSEKNTMWNRFDQVVNTTYRVWAQYLSLKCLILAQFEQTKIFNIEHPYFSFKHLSKLMSMQKSVKISCMLLRKIEICLSIHNFIFWCQTAVADKQFTGVHMYKGWWSFPSKPGSSKMNNKKVYKFNYLMPFLRQLLTFNCLFALFGVINK